MSEPILVCRDIQRSFGNVRALAGANLEVEEGSLLALLGPSGCGKTTLLRLIAGFDTPDAGEISLRGKTISSAKGGLPPEKRRIAMVFQDFALFPHMDVGANVAFGLPKDAKAGRVEQLLKLVRLDGLANRMPHELSGGQQQRVALARALASEPDLILLDEPFSNLDPSVRGDVRREVRALLRAVGITAVIVTHDQEEALSLAGQVAVMIDGVVLQVGSPEEIYDRPVSRAVGEFIGAANVLPGTVSGRRVECALGGFDTEAADGPVDVLFRAEWLAIAEDGTPAEVIDVDYFGYYEMVRLRLKTGETLSLRLPATPEMKTGKAVGVTVRQKPIVFPRSEG